MDGKPGLIAWTMQWGCNLLITLSEYSILYHLYVCPLLSYVCSHNPDLIEESKFGFRILLSVASIILNSVRISILPEFHQYRADQVYQRTTLAESTFSTPLDRY